jgi:predicted DNA-binding protein
VIEKMDEDFFSFRQTKEVSERLEKISGALGISRSEAARRAILAYPIPQVISA